MNWRTPSLAKRVAIGSLLSLVVLSVGMVAVLAAMTRPGYLATDRAAELLGDDLRRGPNGALTLRPDAAVLALADRSPGLWILATDGERLLVHGAPPADARAVFGPVARSLGMFEPTINLRLGPDLRRGHSTTSTVPTEFGQATVMVGGVKPDAIGLLGYVASYFLPAMAAFLVPVLIVMGVVLLMVVAPIVRKGIRPLSRAAGELDGRDLGKRIPERGVMSELLPVVRALNGALDRLQEAFEGRRRFMADVAHEFRTPLAVLTMHADDLPDSAAKSDLQRGIFRMSQMVGQMLDTERLSRPDRQRGPVDLAAVVRTAVADTAPLAVEAGYRMEFAGAEDVTVAGDQHAIRRAVTNLLANAVAHAGGAGAIRVRVTADRTVEVADEGDGVPAEARDRVFEPFHRERWDKDGCGLGLHLVREIMRAHGGRAEVGDTATGAVFRLVFPKPLFAASAAPG